MKMYVGNLPYDTNDQELRDLFAEFGQVTDVHIPKDRDTGRARGFAFVTMESKEAMESALKGLDGKEFNGRSLRLNEAEERRSGGGGGAGGGGGGRGGYGGGGGRGPQGGGGGKGRERRDWGDKGERRDRGNRGNRGGGDRW